MKSLAPLLIAGLLAAGCAAPQQHSAAAQWPGCDRYGSQHQAQRAWVRDGRPPAADGNGDGRVCTSLPATTTAPAEARTCERTSRVVPVGLSNTKYPNILAHAARAAARGYGRVWTLNRAGAAARRDRLLAGIPTRAGYDRDEAPMAAARRGWRADVEYVPSSENRSAGSVVGIKLRRFCDGTRFEYVGY